MAVDLHERLFMTFARLLQAAARKKVYAQRATQLGRPELGHLLRSTSASESVQARRLFNSLRGQIDLSAAYISTIFKQEVGGIIDEYEEVLAAAEEADHKAMIQALSQLQKAERRIAAFLRQGGKRC